MSALGVILARKGSKGVPGKNIRLLKGVPLIAHTIRAGLNSKCIDRLIVSTDSYEIVDVAKEYGACVPFIRPSELAQDDTLSIDALKHAVLESEKIFEENYDVIVNLQCTSPFREAYHIDEAWNIFTSASNIDSVVSVIDMEFSAKRFKLLDEFGFLKDNSDFPERCSIGRRQDSMENFLLRNGAIYMMTRECLFEKNSMVGERCMPYYMKGKYCIDIDTQEDFILAELLSIVEEFYFRLDS